MQKLINIFKIACLGHDKFSKDVDTKNTHNMIYIDISLGYQIIDQLIRAIEDALYCNDKNTFCFLE